MLKRLLATLCLIGLSVQADVLPAQAAPDHTEHAEHSEHDHHDGPDAKSLKELAIGQAVRANDMDATRQLVREWLRLGGDANTMIFMGIVLHHPDFTRLLIAEGANLNGTALGMYKDVPALQVAILEEEEALALILIEAGANLKQRDAEGHTALMRAAVAGQVKVVEALLARQADVLAVNQAKQTASQLMMHNLARARLSERLYTQYQQILSLLDEAEIQAKKSKKEQHP